MLSRRDAETGVGTGVLALGGALAAGALGLPSEAGYGGVGPSFLPWVVAAGLVLCGGFLVREARSGGFRAADAPEGAEQGHWAGFAWVSSGLLSTAALLTTIGFVLACALCFTLAVRGFVASQGRPMGGPRGWAVATITGFAISAPVYWMFTKLLGINLPGLAAGGWI